jgi:hypothetical protein
MPISNSQENLKRNGAADDFYAAYLIWNGVRVPAIGINANGEGNTSNTTKGKSPLEIEEMPLNQECR